MLRNVGNCIDHIGHSAWQVFQLIHPLLLQPWPPYGKSAGRWSVNGLIMHSDQGWQYQHATYRSELQKHKIIQSMSRKGNCYGNCIMETFFGRLKNEMFYGYEKEYTSFEVFSKAIADYIDYYNNRRIQAKTKWMPPVKFREASMMKNELFSSTGAVQIIGYHIISGTGGAFCRSCAQFRLGKMQVLHFCPVVRNQPGRARIVIHDQGKVVGNSFRGQVPKVEQNGLMEFFPFDVFQLHTAEVIPNGEEGPFLVRRDLDTALLGSNAQEHDKFSEIQNVVIGHGVSSYLSDCCRPACLACRAAACD